MKVVHFTRKRGRFTYSLEQVFSIVRGALSKTHEIEVRENPYPSTGLLPRLAAMIWAWRQQGEVNHILGDVHFLCLLLRPRSTVLTIADCVSLERHRGIRYWLLWLFWYWLPIRRASVITVISRSTRQELERHVGLGNRRVEEIPVCISPFYRLVEKPFGADCPVVLQVGTKDNKKPPAGG